MNIDDYYRSEDIDLTTVTFQDLFPLQTVETKKMGTAVNMFQAR